LAEGKGEAMVRSSEPWDVYNGCWVLGLTVQLARWVIGKGRMEVNIPTEKWTTVAKDENKHV